MIYVEVEFRAGGKRYAYEYDGPAEIVPGVDRVEIDTRDGAFVFPVVGVTHERPAFNGQLKSILRVMPREAAEG